MNSLYIDSELGDVAAGTAWPSGLRQKALFLCQTLGENGYWGIALGAMLAAFAIGLLLFRRRSNDATSGRYLFLICASLSALLLLAFRWPTLIHVDLNVDEDFLIAGALLFRHTWDYFGLLDGTTSGPLNFAPLIFFLLSGFRIDLAMARLISLMLVWLALLSMYPAARQAGSTRVAFFATLALSVLFGSFSHEGWVHYSSAHVSVALISIAFSLLVLIIFQRQVTVLRALVFGLILSAMPFAKLQSAPFVPLFLGWFLLLISFHVTTPAGSGKKRLIALITMILTAAPAVLIYLLKSVSSAAEHFWISYIEFSLHYSTAMANTLHDRLWTFRRMIGSNFEIAWVLSLLLLLFTFLAARTVMKRPSTREAIIVLAVCLSALFTGFAAVIVPGRDFTHYLQFPLLPCCSGVVVLAALSINRLRQQTVVPVSAFCLGVIVLLPKLISGHPSFAKINEVPRVHETFVSRVIRPLKYPQDQLAVWGWCVKLHGQTQTSPGTMDIITERHIKPSSLQEYYRARYLNDIVQRRPAFFVDSTGWNSCALDFNDRKRFGHEIFPELRDQIDKDYQFLCDQEQLRLYISFERLLSHIAAPYLYPLIVYLDLTATGNYEYERFEFLLHQLIEREKIRRERNKIETPDVPEILQSMTTQVLDDLVRGGTIPSDTAESLKERAMRVTQRLRQPSSPAVSRWKLVDPIRMYRHIFRK